VRKRPLLTNIVRILQKLYKRENYTSGMRMTRSGDQGGLPAPPAAAAGASQPRRERRRPGGARSVGGAGALPRRAPEGRGPEGGLNAPLRTARRPWWRKPRRRFERRHNLANCKGWRAPPPLPSRPVFLFIGAPPPPSPPRMSPRPRPRTFQPGWGSAPLRSRG